MSRSTSFADLNVRRQSRYKFLAAILQLLLATTVWNGKLTTMVQAAPATDITMNGGDNSASGAALSVPAVFEEKRNWQALQGPWGKRALYSGNWPPETTEVDDEERLVPLFISNGRREDPFLKYSMMYLTNAGTLERLLNQQPRSDEETIGAGYRYNDDLVTSSVEDSDMSNTDDAAVLLSEKRNWNKMNAAWGKRRQAPAWNKFRGAWGKREPGWNNLKGMWGKRASKDWQKLNGGWGKRAAYN